MSGIVEHVCVHTGLRFTLQAKSPEMKLSVKTSDASHPFGISIKGAKVFSNRCFQEGRAYKCDMRCGIGSPPG